MLLHTLQYHLNVHRGDTNDDYYFAVNVIVSKTNSTGIDQFGNAYTCRYTTYSIRDYQIHDDLTLADAGITSVATCVAKVSLLEISDEQAIKALINTQAGNYHFISLVNANSAANLINEYCRKFQNNQNSTVLYK